jgi:HK97 family phage prohead protease
MPRKILSLSDVELKMSADGGGSFVGYASTFNGIDSYNDMILPGAYAGIIAGIKAGSVRLPKMFVNHDSWSSIPLGKWTGLEEDDHGLLVHGELTPGNLQAGQIKAAMQHETIDGLSIGYSLKNTDYINKESDAGQIRIISNISRLAEISVVTWPADDDARIDLTSVKSALDEITSIKEFEDFLRDAGGFSKSLATAAASRAKRLFTRSDSGVIDLPSALPEDLAALIAENFKNSRTL